MPTMHTIEEHEAQQVKPYIDAKVQALMNNIQTNGAVNMLPNEETTQVINGVTFTVNDDGTITVNGTATADAEFILIKSTNALANSLIEKISGITVKLTGCPSGGSANTYCVRKWGQSTSGTYYDTGEGVIFTPSKTSLSDYQWNFQIRIKSGTTVSNLIFKPMISLASLNLSYGDHVPFVKSNKELTDDIVDLDERIKNVVAGTMAIPRLTCTGNTANEVISAAGQYLLFFTGANGKCAMVFVNIHGTDANGSYVETIFINGFTATFDKDTAAKLYVTPSTDVRLRILKIGGTNY